MRTDRLAPLFGPCLLGLVCPLRAQERSPPVPERYLALGDSFTAGTGAPPGAAFPERLAARWRQAGHRVILKNVAVAGYTTDDLIDRELPQVRPFRPELVTLAVGANDLFRGGEEGRYRAQIRRIVAALREAEVQGPRIWALPQPDWSLAPALGGAGDRPALRARIERFNLVLREEVEAAGGCYLDLFPLMRRQAQAGQFAPDGLHPNAAALDEWAGALYEALGRLRGPLRRPERPGPRLQGTGWAPAGASAPGPQCAPPAPSPGRGNGPGAQSRPGSPGLPGAGQAASPQ